MKLSLFSTIFGIVISAFFSLIFLTLNQFFDIKDYPLLYFFFGWILVMIILLLIREIISFLEYDLPEISKGELPENSFEYFSQLNMAIEKKYFCKCECVSKNESTIGLILQVICKLSSIFSPFIPIFIVFFLCISLWASLKFFYWVWSIILSPHISALLAFLCLFIAIIVIIQFDLPYKIINYFNHGCNLKIKIISKIALKYPILIQYNIKNESITNEFPLKLFIDLKEKSFYFHSIDPDNPRTKKKILKIINEVIDKCIKNQL